MDSSAKIAEAERKIQAWGLLKSMSGLVWKLWYRSAVDQSEPFKAKLPLTRSPETDPSENRPSISWR